MRAAPLAFALVAAFVLAGCAGGGDTASSDPLGAQLSGVEANPQGDTGCIRGVVVDEAIRPVAKAQVRLTAGGRNATADGNGIFVFCELKPGVHFLSASALGYGTAQTSAEVQAGKTSDVRISIPTDRSPKPYHVTLPFKGFIEFWGGIGQFFVEDVANSLGQNTNLCNCYLHFTPDGNLSAIVFEAVWQQTTPDPTGAMDNEFYWNVGQPSSDSSMFEQGYCASPCRADVSIEDYTPGETVAYLQGPDEYVAFEQPYEMYVTLWYRGSPPKDWSFVKGDK